MRAAVRTALTNATTKMARSFEQSSLRWFLIILTSNVTLSSLQEDAHPQVFELVKITYRI